MSNEKENKDLLDPNKTDETVKVKYSKAKTTIENKYVITNKDGLIDILEIHYCGRGVGRSRAGKYNDIYEQKELYIDMVNKKVIEGKQAINNYQTQIEIPPKK